MVGRSWNDDGALKRQFHFMANCCWCQYNLYGVAIVHSILLCAHNLRSTAKTAAGTFINTGHKNKDLLSEAINSFRLWYFEALGSCSPPMGGKWRIKSPFISNQKNSSAGHPCVALHMFRLPHRICKHINYPALIIVSGVDPKLANIILFRCCSAVHSSYCLQIFMTRGNRPVNRGVIIMVCLNIRVF
jgi:hypothetical protein